MGKVPPPYQFVMSKADFLAWFNQEIYFNSLVIEERKHYFPRFAEELGSIMKSYGYTMDSRWNSLTLAKWVYRIHVQEIARKKFDAPVWLGDIIHRDWNEDHSRYEEVIGDQDFTTYFQMWRDNEDFDTQSRVGQRLFRELPEFLYVYIDMEKSKQGQFIEELFDSDSDYAEETQVVKQDAYLQDAASGYHGGTGFKV